MANSCEWILDDAEFKGKTMIAISLADVFLKQVKEDPQKVFAYFFCDNTTDKRNTALKALKSVLHQILKQNPNNVLLEDFQTQGPEMFCSVEAVWLALLRVLESAKINSVDILIDGLDECEGDTLVQFLELLSKHLGGPKRGRCRVKWVVTSRNEVVIREFLDFATQIDLEANFKPVSKAVEAFIDLKVDELAIRKRYDQELKQVVRDGLREKAEGTFLWVSLACSELRKRSVSTINTRLVLSRLPPGLSRLYSRIMDQVMRNDFEEMVGVAVEILRAVTIAMRPLHLGELAVLTGLPCQARSNPEEAFKYAEQCGSFLTFRDDEVYLVHQSAKDYLLQHQCAVLFPAGSGTMNERAARRCLEYVTQHWMVDLRTAEHKPRLKMAASPSEKTAAAISYPLLHWVEHSNSAGESISDTFDQYPEFFRENSEIRRLWLKYYREHSTKPNLRFIRVYKFTALHIAAICDTGWIANRLLEYGSQHINVRDMWGLTPLQWAIQCNSPVVAKLLVNKGAELEREGIKLQTKKSPRMGTPLGLAVSFNNVEITKFLLESGANVNGQDNMGMTPLTWSIATDCATLTKILLDRGAKVNVRNANGKTPLHLAAVLGNQSICKLLLKAGAFVNAQDVNGLSPIHGSAFLGHVETSKILYAHGARKFEGDQAEQWALTSKSKAVTQQYFGDTSPSPFSASDRNERQLANKLMRSAGAIQRQSARSAQLGTTVQALSSWGFQPSDKWY